MNKIDIPKAKEELRKIVNDWDLLDLISHAPDDEYDYFRDALLVFIQSKDVNKASLAKFLEKEIETHFQMEKPKSFDIYLDKIWDWYISSFAINN